MKLFALDSRSNTAFALRKRDTRLAVLFRPPDVGLRDGDDVVDPFKLVMLPLSLSLNGCVAVAVVDDELLFNLSIDIA